MLDRLQYAGFAGRETLVQFAFIGAVLAAIGRQMNSTLRRSDLKCRYGGEEFVLVMPHTPIAQARLAAERVRSAIEQTKVKFDGKSFSVTASVGVAEFDSDDDCKQILRKADESVYAAKAAGRNCIYWHDGKQPQLVEVDSNDAPVTRRTLTTANTVEAFKNLPTWELFSNELGRRVAESHRFGLPLTVMLPVPGLMRTRAVDVLRRPVPQM